MIKAGTTGGVPLATRRAQPLTSLLSYPREVLQLNSAPQPSPHILLRKRGP